MKRIVLLILAVFSVVSAYAAANSFPTLGIMPKEEVGALRFLEKHPEYDGRSVVVAIFDTGVDPGAEGLQLTSDGKPKIIDIIDGSGSGDVDTSTVVKAKDGQITGLTGRTLKLNPDWKPAQEEFHIGIKRAFELYPGKLVTRVKAKRREDWDRRQRGLMTREKRRLANFDKSFPKPNKQRKKQRAEIEERLRQLKSRQGKYDDPGPIYDCVVFNDGESWRAVVDTDEDGDLMDEKVLTNYKAEREYGTFSRLDLLNYALNIYDHGNLLSIVADCGAHGSHVAGIVAGNYPRQPELNGIAPGAQIVSVKIGDTRIGSSSLGTGETRGMIAALQNRCDLVNMSYGGDSLRPNQDRHGKLFTELVNKHGVIFVSSAGNNGPALSTVGSPGGTTSALIGVGAHVTPQMMKIQYSLRDGGPAQNYTWTSRGPTFDGDLGVDITAPGGAIAPVSNWTLQRNMQMNGTSMSSPNACGAIALLLSAAKAEKIRYSPARVRRALMNTAEPIADVSVFAQGRGMIQIDRAWEFLKENRRTMDHDLRFRIDVTNRDHARGVYLREAFELKRPFEAAISVIPEFHERADNRQKVKFGMQIELQCDADWVDIPDHLMLMHGGRNFRALIDGPELDQGTHYTEIVGIDAAHPERGAVFRVPVTVIVPNEAGDEVVAWEHETEFEAGELQRHFIAVPKGAQWADLRMRSENPESGRRLVVHSVQKLPGKMFSQHSSRNYFTFLANDEKVHSFPVVGERTLELCLAQYWSVLGESAYSFELRFHGITPSSRHIYVDGAEPYTRIDVTAGFENEVVSPSGALTSWRQTVLPVDSMIRPLNSVRDRLPDERQLSELVLTYSVSQDAKGSVGFRFGVNDEWESALWTVHDTRKRPLATGTSGKTASLPKGSYKLRVHLRHESAKLLEKMKTMPVHLERKLSKSVSLSFKASGHDALVSGKSFAEKTLPRGERTFMYVAAPSRSSLPKGAKAGDVLRGTVNFGKEQSKLLGNGKRPGGYRISYRVPPALTPKKTTAQSASVTKKKKSEEELTRLAIRDLKIARLARLYSEKSKSDFDRVSKELLQEWPDHLPVLIHQLKRLDQDSTRKKHLGDVIAAADRVIGQIDTKALREHYGANLDPDDEAAAKVRKEMDRQKPILADALYLKGRAIAYAEDMILRVKEAAKVPADQKPKAETAEVPPKLERRAFEKNFRELGKWVNTTDDAYVLLHIRHDRRQRRFASGLKLLEARMAKMALPDKKYLDKRVKILDSLGWKDWVAYEKKWNILRFPKAYQPF
ncbi:MAG: tripeptidyl-peptidase-2 [Limisphaerales bacterium]|jgi:tripeptidyl-peptidase-2